MTTSATATPADESGAARGHHFRHTREYTYLGVRVIVLGTAHISAESVRDVEALVREVRPTGLFLELCRSRSHMLTIASAPGGLRPVPITAASVQAAYRSGGAPQVLQLVLSSFMVEAAMKLGSDSLPGAEFSAAAAACKEHGAVVCLGDREVSITLKRAMGALSFFEKLRLLWTLMTESLDDLTVEELEKLKENDFLTAMIKEVSEEFPNLLEPLVNERDRYMSYTLRSFCSILRQRAPSPEVPLTVLAVVGMGHMNGIEKALALPINEKDLEEISRVPPTVPWSRWILTRVVVPCAITTAAYFAFRRYRPSLRFL